jgi:hypothetical protein
MPYTLRKVKNKRRYSVSNKKSTQSTMRIAKKPIILLNALNKNFTFKKIFRGGRRGRRVDRAYRPKNGQPIFT